MLSQADTAASLEVVQEEEVVSKEEVLNFLVAIGVNTCNRSYENHHKEMKNKFLEMDLKEIAPCWDHLDDSVKICVITQHSDEFKSWVNGG
jgi:hypothetical protein